MKTLYLLSIAYISLVLTGCATPSYYPSRLPVCPPPSIDKAKKNPLKITFYTKGAPKQHYSIIGEGSISKYNLGGNRRQEANIHDSMRELAAAMGGDAVINIKHNAKSITGTIVAFQEASDKSG